MKVQIQIKAKISMNTTAHNKNQVHRHVSQKNWKSTLSPIIKFTICTANN